MRTQRGRTRRNIESAPRPGLEPRGSTSARTAHLRESAPAPTIPAKAHPPTRKKGARARTNGGGAPDHVSIPTKARPLEQRDASCPRAKREPASLGSPITSSGRTACTGADAPTRTSLPTCTGSRACGRNRSAGAARGCGGPRRRSPWPGTAPRWSRSRSSS